MLRSFVRYLVEPSFRFCCFFLCVSVFLPIFYFFTVISMLLWQSIPDKMRVSKNSVWVCVWYGWRQSTATAPQWRQNCRSKTFKQLINDYYDYMSAVWHKQKAISATRTLCTCPSHSAVFFSLSFRADLLVCDLKNTKAFLVRCVCLLFFGSSTHIIRAWHCVCVCVWSCKWTSNKKHQQQTTTAITTSTSTTRTTNGKWQQKEM